jgi:hypothetical protein
VLLHLAGALMINLLLRAGIATLPGIPDCEPNGGRKHDNGDDDLKDNDHAHKKPSHSLMNQR